MVVNSSGKGLANIQFIVLHVILLRKYKHFTDHGY